MEMTFLVHPNFLYKLGLSAIEKILIDIGRFLYFLIYFSMDITYKNGDRFTRYVMVER